MQKKILLILICAFLFYGCTNQESSIKNDTKTDNSPVIESQLVQSDSWTTQVREEIERRVDNSTTRMNQTITLLIDFTNNRYLINSTTNDSHFFFNGAYYKITEKNGKCNVERTYKSFNEIEDATLGFFAFLEFYRQKDPNAYAALLNTVNQTEAGVVFPSANDTGELGGTFTRYKKHYFGENLTYIYNKTDNGILIYRFQYVNTKNISQDDVARAIDEKIAYVNDLECTVPSR